MLECQVRPAEGQPHLALDAAADTDGSDSAADIKTHAAPDFSKPLLQRKAHIRLPVAPSGGDVHTALLLSGSGQTSQVAGAAQSDGPSKQLPPQILVTFASIHLFWQMY